MNLQKEQVGASVSQTCLAGNLLFSLHTVRLPNGVSQNIPRESQPSTEMIQAGKWNDRACAVLFKSTMEQVWKMGWEVGKPAHVIVAGVSWQRCERSW